MPTRSRKARTWSGSRKNRVHRRKAGWAAAWEGSGVWSSGRSRMWRKMTGHGAAKRRPKMMPMGRYPSWGVGKARTIGMGDQGRGHARAQGEGEADGVEAGPLVVVQGDLGGQGRVGDHHQGEDGGKEDVREEGIGEPGRLAREGGGIPVEREGEEDQDGAGQEVGPAAAEAAPGAVGDGAHQGIAP